MGETAEEKRIKALARAKARLRDTIRQDASLTDRARVVGEQYIAKHVNKYCYEAWPAFSTIAEGLGGVRRRSSVVPTNWCGPVTSSKSSPGISAIAIAFRQSTSRWGWTGLGQERDGWVSPFGNPCPPAGDSTVRQLMIKLLNEIEYARSGDQRNLFVITLGSEEAEAWEKKLRLRQLPPLSAYKLGGKGIAYGSMLLPVLEPPNIYEERAWKPVERYLKSRLK